MPVCRLSATRKGFRMHPHLHPQTCQVAGCHTPNTPEYSLPLQQHTLLSTVHEIIRCPIVRPDFSHVTCLKKRHLVRGHTCRLQPPGFIVIRIACSTAIVCTAHESTRCLIVRPAFSHVTCLKKKTFCTGTCRLQPRGFTVILLIITCSTAKKKLLPLKEGVILLGDLLHVVLRRVCDILYSR